MQPGNAHQVIHAGAREHLPLCLRNTALIADGQCTQYAGIRRAAECGVKLVSHYFTPGFDAVVETVGQCSQAHVIRLVVHITHCAHIVLQRPHFKVGAVRVAAAMRLFEAQRESPAFSSVQRKRSGWLLIVGAEVNVRRHTGLWSENFFHIEAETQTLLAVARQLGDHADHFDVATLPLIRQRNGEALLGLPCGEIETKSAGKGGD